jgi:hypothetical protein
MALATPTVEQLRAALALLGYPAPDCPEDCELSEAEHRVGFQTVLFVLLQHQLVHVTEPALQEISQQAWPAHRDLIAELCGCGGNLPATITRQREPSP